MRVICESYNRPDWIKLTGQGTPGQAKGGIADAHFLVGRRVFRSLM